MIKVLLVHQTTFQPINMIGYHSTLQQGVVHMLYLEGRHVQTKLVIVVYVVILTFNISIVSGQKCDSLAHNRCNETDFCDMVIHRCMNCWQICDPRKAQKKECSTLCPAFKAPQSHTTVPVQLKTNEVPHPVSYITSEPPTSENMAALIFMLVLVIMLITVLFGFFIHATLCRGCVLRDQNNGASGPFMYPCCGGSSFVDQNNGASCPYICACCGGCLFRDQNNRVLGLTEPVIGTGASVARSDTPQTSGAMALKQFSHEQNDLNKPSMGRDREDRPRQSPIIGEADTSPNLPQQPDVPAASVLNKQNDLNKSPQRRHVERLNTRESTLSEVDTGASSFSRKNSKHTNMSEMATGRSSHEPVEPHFHIDEVYSHQPKVEEHPSRQMSYTLAGSYIDTADHPQQQQSKDVIAAEVDDRVLSLMESTPLIHTREGNRREEMAKSIEVRDLMKEAAAEDETLLKEHSQEPAVSFEPLPDITATNRNITQQEEGTVARPKQPATQIQPKNQPKEPAESESKQAARRHPNRRIYDILRGLWWVEGYFSEGRSIDVFIDINEISPEVAMVKLCEMVDVTPDKFHIKSDREM